MLRAEGAYRQAGRHGHEEKRNAIVVKDQHRKWRKGEQQQRHTGRDADAHKKEAAYQVLIDIFALNSGGLKTKIRERPDKRRDSAGHCQQSEISRNKQTRQNKSAQKLQHHARELRTQCERAAVYRPGAKVLQYVLGVERAPVCLRLR